MKSITHRTFFLLGGFALITPYSASASSAVGKLLVEFHGILNQIVPIIIGLALIMFLWGIFQYLFAKGDGDKAAARSFMVWGIVGLVVMVSVWGFVGLIQKTIFKQDPSKALKTIELPQPRR